MIEPYGLDFTTDSVLCIKDSSVRITPFPKGLTTIWRNLPLQLFPNFPPGGSIFSEVLWEITWINFRFDLFRLHSHLLFPEDPHPYSARFLKVWQVLEDVEDCDQEKLAYIRSFPESDFGITHPDPDVRLIFLGRFAQLECEWGKPLSPTLSQWKNWSLVQSWRLKFFYIFLRHLSIPLVFFPQFLVMFLLQSLPKILMLDLLTLKFFYFFTF